MGFIMLRKDAIIAKAIEGLNQNLDAVVKVDGKIDITFISTFPSLTLEFQKVYIEDKFLPKKALADVDLVNFTINPFSLFGDEISFKNIILSNGAVNLKTYKDGKSNFDILKENKDDENTGKGISLDLEKILLHNIDLIYDDEKNNIFLDGLIVGASVSGKFKASDFDIYVDLKSDIKLLNISKTHFLEQNLVSGEFALFYKAENQCISFKKNTINIDENIFNFSGEICVGTNTINLTASAKGKELKNALKLVPKDLFNLDGITGNGAYEISVLFSEKLNKPKLKIDFSLAKANAAVKGVSLKFEDLYASGSYSNFPKSNLVLKDFAFKTGKSHLKGNLFLPNLNVKQMQIKANGEIYSTELQKFDFKIIDFNDNGKISLNNLDLDFRYSQKDTSWIVSKLTGAISLENLNGNLLEIEQKYSLNAKLNAIGRKIEVENLQFNIGENDIRFNGNLDNALNFFQKNVLKTNDALDINGSIYSANFDINTFLKSKLSEEKPVEEVKKELDLVKWLNFSCNLSLKIDKLKYRKLEIVDLSSKISSRQAGIFNLVNMSANGLGGQVVGDVDLRFGNNKTLEVAIDSRMKNIDINKLFIAFDNFDQKSITNQNIKGNLTADLKVAMSFSDFVNFNSKDLLVNTNFVLENGELINLPSLKALSKFLSVEQLEHIYFSKYQSNITIIDEVVYLEKNMVKSNLISLEIGGSHSFNNKIDYLIKLNLNNLLAAKFKKKKTLQEDYVNDIMGGINLFISMKGDVDNPIIKLEKRSDFKEIAKEDKETKNTIKEEFKEYYKKDDPSKEIKKEFYFENGEEEFIDFDEE